MPATGAVEFVIQGVTLDGKPFRPSDWAERLCGVMSAFGGDRRMQYSPFVHPVTFPYISANIARRSPPFASYRSSDGNF